MGDPVMRMTIGRCVVMNVAHSGGSEGSGAWDVATGQTAIILAAASK